MRFEERARNFELAEMDMKTIHGETDIVLKNVKTGLVERFHDENTFQSAVLANFMRTHGIFGVKGPFDWKQLVGGLYLFRDQITAGTELMPAGNRMIGNGAFECLNNGLCTEFGSYNSSDSTNTDQDPTVSAIRQVYDFTTSQANGTISCVCLGNYNGARIGYGNESQYRANLAYMINYSPNNNGVADIQKNRFYYNGFRYTVIGISESILTIRKERLSGNPASVWNGLYHNLTFDLTQIGHHWDDVFDYPYTINVGDVGGGKFRFILSDSSHAHNVASGSKIYYYEFDATADSLTEEELTNSSSKTVVVGGGSIRFFSNYTVIQTTEDDPHAVVINVDNGTLVYEVPTVRPFGPSDSNRDFPPSEINDGLILFQVKESSLRQGGSSNRIWALLDCTAGTLRAVNLLGEADYADRHYDVGTRIKGTSMMRNEGYAANNYKFNNPFYLATINNLSSPVTKTAAQTMKVTYTLTEV